MRFRVNGTPAPQGSKRHVGGGRMVEMSKAVGPWREAVRTEAQRAMEAGARPFGAKQPVSVSLTFVFRRPASHYLTGKKTWMLLRDAAPQHPAGPPDWDKLGRAVSDALQQSGLIHDDAQIVAGRVVKTYASNGEAPGAVIEVEAL